MFGWIKESAVYETGLIGSSSWDEESSSYKVQLPAEVLQEAARVMDKGYLFLIHATIEVDGSLSGVYLQAIKLDTQDGEVQGISFADGSTLAGGLLTITSGEGGGGTPGIKNIWDSTGTGAVAGGNSNCVSNGAYCLAFGDSCTSSGRGSIAFGIGSQATISSSFSNGTFAKATGTNSHAEGQSTTASSSCAHAEGSSTTASGANSHSEGQSTRAEGRYSHAEGSNTKALADGSHSEGLETIANGSYQHVSGLYNIEDDTSLEIVGNGNVFGRSNARKLDSSGNEYLAGQIQPENGLRLKAPNGTYYNVIVDNAGALSIVAAT